MDKNISKADDKDLRAWNYITIIIFLLIVIGFSIIIYVIPEKSFSEQENRYLQQMPKINNGDDLKERLCNGKFTKEVSNFYADQFPMRDIFVGVKAYVEIAMQKGENNAVVLAKDGYIVKKNLYPNYDILDHNIKMLTKFNQYAKENNIKYNIAVAGRSEDILIDYLPKDYPIDISEKLWKYTDEKLKKDMSFINLYTVFRNIENADESQLYYKTDHHWTTYGAYIAAEQIVKSLNVELDYSLNDYTKVEVTDEFYGTTWSSAGMKWIKPDSIYFYRYAGDEEFVTKIINKNIELTGFYDYEYLDKKDKYSSFIGGNNVRVDICKKTETEDGQNKREKMIIVKDSFAHSVIPFLAQKFDLIVIDPRYYIGSIGKLCEQESVDNVLVLVNMDTLVTKKDFSIMH